MTISTIFSGSKLFVLKLSIGLNGINTMLKERGKRKLIKKKRKKKICICRTR